MMELHGVHGTCRSNSYQIQKRGFDPGRRRGRRGVGVYFWAYRDPKLKTDAMELAISWWRQSLHRGSYRRANDNRCALIYASLIDIKNLLDFDDIDVHETFVSFANEVINKDYQSYNEEAGRIYDLFVKMMEEELGVVFDVILVRVTPPDRIYYKPSLPLDLTGNPWCLVVKDPKVIRITQIEREDQRESL